MIGSLQRPGCAGLWALRKARTGVRKGRRAGGWGQWALTERMIFHFSFLINNFLSSPPSFCSSSFNLLGLVRSSKLFGCQACGCHLGGVSPFHPLEDFAPWRRGPEARVQTDPALFKAKIALPGQYLNGA